MQPQSKVHPFSYFVARKGKRQLQPHQRRDLGAVVELLEPLGDIDLRMGRAILNTPPRIEPEEDSVQVKRGKIDISFMGPDDYILQTTRPPMDDVDQGYRKRVERGYTDLEDLLFHVWRRYFDVSSRMHMLFTEPVRAELIGDYANRRDIEFVENTCSPYKRMNALDRSRTHRPPAGKRTMAFFLRTQHTWENGPGLIGAFGMDGVSTLAWCYRLSQDFKHLLSEPSFVIAELTPTTVPARNFDLEWAMDWKVDLLLRIPA